MTKFFTSSILAMSIAFSSLTVAPAQAANNEDLGKFLAGAITLMIIGKAIEDSSKKSKSKAAVTKKYSPDYSSNEYRRKLRRRSLPEECLFQVRTNRGLRDVFGKRCLQEEMRHAKRLPKVCEDNVRVRHGRRADVYGALCLRKHGYRIEARNRR